MQYLPGWSCWKDVRTAEVGCVCCGAALYQGPCLVLNNGKREFALPITKLFTVPTPSLN